MIDCKNGRIAASQLLEVQAIFSTNNLNLCGNNTLADVHLLLIYIYAQKRNLKGWNSTMKSTLSSIAAGVAVVAALGAGAYMLGGGKQMKKMMRNGKLKKNAGMAIRAVSDFVEDLSSMGR